MNSSVKLRSIDPLVQGHFVIFDSKGKGLFEYEPDNPGLNNRQIPEEFLDKTVDKIYPGGWTESILIIYIDM